MTKLGRRVRALRRVLRRVVAVSAPPWPRLALATGLGVLGGAATVGLLAGSGAVVAKAAFRPGLGAIAGLLAAVEVVAFLRGPLRYAERLVGHDAALRILTRWRVWLYDRLEPLSPAGLKAWRSGDLLDRAMQDVDTLQDLYVRVLPSLVVATTTSALAIVVVGILLPAGALVMAAALAVALVVGPSLALVSRRAQAEMTARRGEMVADVVELVEGSADLTAFGRAGAMLERIEAADRRLTSGARRRALLDGLSGAMVTLCLGATVVGVMILAAVAVRHHQLQPVMVAVLPLAAIAAFEAVAPVSGAVVRLADVVTAGRRLLAIEDIPAPVVDPVSPLAVPEDPWHPQLSDARLRYGEDLPWALDGMDLDLAPGAKVAVSGHSGSGKSSTITALLRFWALEGSGYTVNGVPVEHLEQAEVRQRFGWLDQHADLFTGTIRDNITLGRAATDAEMAAVVRLSQLETWLSELPDGLETQVGEHGGQVSGGQRQRVALARTLLGGPPVLVLDEPTAGLDAGTAGRLLDDVLAAADHQTVLLVTHRPEEATRCPTRLTMDAGRVVQRHVGDEIRSARSARSARSGR